MTTVILTLGVMLKCLLFMIQINNKECKIDFLLHVIHRNHTYNNNSVEHYLIKEHSIESISDNTTIVIRWKEVYIRPASARIRYNIKLQNRHRNIKKEIRKRNKSYISSQPNYSRGSNQLNEFGNNGNHSLTNYTETLFLQRSKKIFPFSSKFWYAKVRDHLQNLIDSENIQLSGGRYLLYAAEKVKNTNGTMEISSPNVRHCGSTYVSIYISASKLTSTKNWVFRLGEGVLNISSPTINNNTFEDWVVFKTNNFSCDNITMNLLVTCETCFNMTASKRRYSDLAAFFLVRIVGETNSTLPNKTLKAEKHYQNISCDANEETYSVMDTFAHSSKQPNCVTVCNMNVIPQSNKKSLISLICCEKENILRKKTISRRDDMSHRININKCKTKNIVIT